MSDDRPPEDATDEDRTADDEDHEPDDDEPLGDLADEIPPPEVDADPDAPDGESPRHREGPMGDIAEELDAAGEPGDGPADQLFEEVDDVGEIDRRALWRQVAGEEAAARIDDVDDGADEPDGPTVQRPDGPAGGTVDVEDRQERVVEKAKYCQGCEYFSPPPDVHCNHDGTEILELVDVDHFRVADCPIVAEDEELENV